jgi:hypothetical protein
VVRDRLLMTNAHVVADQTYVTVKRHGSSTKYTAGEGGGLMLEVFDQGFFLHLEGGRTQTRV